MPPPPRAPFNPAQSPKSPPLSELTGRQISWLGAGFLMTLSSAPGQTIFIAQFNAALREAFSLSHGEFGVLYTIATLASSVLLIWAGGLADRFSPRALGIACLFGLATIALGMSQVTSIFALGLAIFGLRFFGQGMMGHIAMTAMSRWFNRFRGRALSFAQMGYPSAEAALPFLLTISIVAIGWRQVWLAAAGFLVLVLVPLIAYLLRDPPDGKRALAAGIVNPDGEVTSEPTGQAWTRARVLRDPLFYLVLTGIMAPAAIGTLYIFHQAHLADIKGWDITTFTAFFPFLSLTVVLVSILSGILVDRYGAWRILPYVLIPEGIGCIALGLFGSVWLIPAFFVTFGMTGGMMSPVIGALWAELYGTAHLGKIRALATSGMVLASAIGPGLAGTMIDLDFDLDRQSYIYAAYCFAIAALFFVNKSRFQARVSAMNAERAALS